MGSQAEDHEHIITTNLAELVDTIGVIGVNGITWDCLVSSGVLSNGDRKYIVQTNPGERDQVRELLYLLCRRPRADFDKFASVLVKTKQSEVLKILRHYIMDPLPDGSHEDVITRNLADLVDEIGMIGVNGMTWDYLVTNGVLSKGDRRYIQQTNPGERDQVRELLHLLCRRPRADYEKFIVALSTTRQTKVLQILGESAADVPNNTHNESPSEDAKTLLLKDTQQQPTSGGNQNACSEPNVLPGTPALSREEMRAKRLERLAGQGQAVSSSQQQETTNLSGSVQAINAQVSMVGNSKTHEDIITEKLAELVDGIGVIGVHGMTWDHLVSAGVLSKGDRKYIQQTNPGERDQVRELLYLLCRRPRADYEKFIDVFWKTRQTGVLKLLGEEDSYDEHHARGDLTKKRRTNELDTMDIFKCDMGGGDPGAPLVTVKCVNRQ